LVYMRWRVRHATAPITDLVRALTFSPASF
jgi:hypothetical protein